MPISFVRRGLCLLALLLTTSPVSAGVLMQGFYWDAYDPARPWWDLLAHRSSELSANGFTAVWIPPVLKGASGPYSVGYDPYDDYDIGSKDQRGGLATHWGRREELTRAVAVMKANGLDVYLDSVLAHRNGDSGDSHFRYRDAWGHPKGGRFEKWPDYFLGNNPFGRALNLRHPFVKEKIIPAGEWLIRALGIQGLRIDYAVGVDTDFLREYLGTGAMASMYAVAEYWSENRGELEHYLYGRMGGRVTAFDFPLWGQLKDMANGRGGFDMRKLVDAGLIRTSPALAVTFVENHDTDKNYPTTANKHLGYAFILTSEGYPTVFWKDYYDFGMKALIDPLVWIHEKLAAGGTKWRWSDADLLVFERASGLLVGLNDNPVAERSEWVQTDFGGNVWLHDYTGNGPAIRTEADGRVRVPVKANSYVAYARPGRGDAHQTASYRTRQQLAGARDLDIPPAVKGVPRSFGRIWVEGGSWMEGTLHHQAGGVEGHLELRFVGPHRQQVETLRPPLSAGATAFRVLVPHKGWYSFEIAVAAAGGPAEVPFWLDLEYQAPRGL